VHCTVPSVLVNVLPLHVVHGCRPFALNVPDPHTVPLQVGSGELAHPLDGLQKSLVHSSPSSQLSGPVATHSSFAHPSLAVQMLPSEHAVPSGLPAQALTQAV
jgi:hypothetical protein